MSHIKFQPTHANWLSLISTRLEQDESTQSQKNLFQRFLIETNSIMAISENKETVPVSLRA